MRLVQVPLMVGDVPDLACPKSPLGSVTGVLSAVMPEYCDGMLLGVLVTSSPSVCQRLVVDLEVDGRSVAYQVLVGPESWEVIAVGSGGRQAMPLLPVGSNARLSATCVLYGVLADGVIRLNALFVAP